MHKELQHILGIYNIKKGMIRNFFSSINRKSDEYVFGELMFCLLTPQARAKSCREVINNLKSGHSLFTVSKEELQSLLKNVRFHEKKVDYLIKVREMWPEIKDNLANTKDVRELRNWLAENVLGFGLKESTHFLRNIGMGFGSLAILDIHVQNFMRNLGIHDAKSLNKKVYFELENKFLDLSKEVGIPAEELDIAIWLYQSKENEFYG
jgi:N-glycosylase/DNA lyase